MKKGKFGVLLYSRAYNDETFNRNTEVFDSFIHHLQDKDVVNAIYFVDDSKPVYQEALFNILQKSSIDIVKIYDNGSFFNACNNAWMATCEEFVISFYDDFRLVQDLPLGVIKKAFDAYREIYLIYLGVRCYPGYASQSMSDQMIQKYPYMQVFKDGMQPSWYHVAEEKKVISIPKNLYQLQLDKALPGEIWGNELLPAIVDEKNTLWTTRVPPALLKHHSTSHESFVGGPSVFRSSAIKKYIPIPDRYKGDVAQMCGETYFLKQDIDCFYFTAYLNLQAFAVPYKDPARLLSCVDAEYFDDFVIKNGRPVAYLDIQGEKWPGKQRYLFSLLWALVKLKIVWHAEGILFALFGRENVRRVKGLLTAK